MTGSHYSHAIKRVLVDKSSLRTKMVAGCTRSSRFSSSDFTEIAVDAVRCIRREGEAIDLHMLHPGVLDIRARGRRDFSRFDPSPGEGRPHFSKSSPVVVSIADACTSRRRPLLLEMHGRGPFQQCGSSGKHQQEQWAAAHPAHLPSERDADRVLRGRALIRVCSV